MEELTARGPAPTSRREAWVAFEAAQLELEAKREAMFLERKAKSEKLFARNLRAVGALKFAHETRVNRGCILVKGFDGTEEWVTPPVVGKLAAASSWSKDQNWGSKWAINSENYPLHAIAQMIAHLTPRGHPVYPDVLYTRRVDGCEPLLTPEIQERVKEMEVEVVEVHPHRTTVLVHLRLYGGDDPLRKGHEGRLMGLPSAWGCSSKEELFHHLGEMFLRVYRRPRDSIPVGLLSAWDLAIRLFHE